MAFRFFKLSTLLSHIKCYLFVSQTIPCTSYRTVTNSVHGQWDVLAGRVGRPVSDCMTRGVVVHRGRALEWRETEGSRGLLQTMGSQAVGRVPFKPQRLVPVPDG